ncbi:uncharacterized protein LOC114322757 [Camellia sinensis]|uniref:uncharacterized protein LOC114322757 n=1 Tax=Camellia sinensis TaxID=4442 RepID=UPI001035BFF0|nr:uncharacterized protein LOC114322757 [Camellia sinensis]
MSELDDNWPCKSDDTPELESRVNLLSGQRVNKATDIPRASGKGNNDFTFPCGPSVAEDDDDDNEVIESKIRAFLDEKGLEVDYSGSGHCDDDMCQIDDEDDLVIGASAKFDFTLLSDDFNKRFNPMFEPDDNWPCKFDDTPEKFPGNVPHWGSGNCDDDMCQIDDEDDLVIGASGKFDFTLLSDDFNKSFNPMSEPNDNWPCKFDDTPEKFPGNVPHWGSGNCDDDMRQIDDEDDLVIGASANYLNLPTKVVKIGILHRIIVGVY